MTHNKSAFFACDLVRPRAFVIGAPLVFLIAISGALTQAVHAGLIGTNLVWISMSDGQGRQATTGIANPFANGAPGDVPEKVEETISDRVELKDGNNVLGWVDELSVSLESDPVASINFSLTAGASNVTVTVASATVAFPALTSPPASADAEITLTDNGGAAATVTVSSGNNGVFRAIYNGAQEYAALIGNSSVGGGTATFSQNTSVPIAGSVSSIQAQFSFVLSAGDSASGTGNFTVVPEPATTGLLIVACAGALRLRRGR